MVLLRVLILVFFVNCCYAQFQLTRRKFQLQIPQGLQIKRRIQNYYNRRADSVCYETLGCFNVSHKRSPLNKLPASPQELDTKFYLFTKSLNFSHPNLIHYEDKGTSLTQSKFEPKQPTKIIIHGYLGRWNERGALETAATFLKICNCNVLVLDWENGAKGPQYAHAAANTELVGRQLGILLLHMINRGSKAQDMHLVGFSLGAHVAGCASEVLKSKGHLLGRITGLDAASPLFRHSHFKDKSRKLDKDDAIFVDAIHTDASPNFAEGFGLLEPFAHVDFFPNGGFEQPGCSDGAASVFLTHLEGTITREAACSHLRAWLLFLETLKQKALKANDCEFIAYKCKGGLGSFQKGDCFPQISKSGDLLALDPTYRTELGKLGVDAQGEGVMYLMTRGNPPFCGMQLQISIMLSTISKFPKGEILINVQHGNATTDFKITDKIHTVMRNRREINGLGVTVLNGLKSEIKQVIASLEYIPEESKNYNNSEIYLDRVVLYDMYGYSWHYCKDNVLVQNSYPVYIKMYQKPC